MIDYFINQIYTSWSEKIFPDPKIINVLARNGKPMQNILSDALRNIVKPSQTLNTNFFICVLKVEIFSVKSP